jgi:hypothetical protein
MRRLAVLLLVLFTAARASAQNQQAFPRIRITFDGSSTVNSLDLGGWTRIRTAGATPGISVAGEMRWYFNGTNLMISENGGAYHVVGPALPASVFTSLGAFQTQAANTLFAGPVSGGVAVPAFRVLVNADLPADVVRTTYTGFLFAATGVTGGTMPVSSGSEGRIFFNATSNKWQISENGGAYFNVDRFGTAIDFGEWSQNGCSTGNIPKWNGSAWACAGDDTSPGGSSWLTTGNGGTGGTGYLGTSDAQPFQLRANAISVVEMDTSGNANFWRDVFAKPVANALATVGAQAIDSTKHCFTARRWTGAVSQDQEYCMYADQGTATAGDNVWRLTYNGSTVATIDSGGNLTPSGSFLTNGTLGGAHTIATTERASPGASSANNGKIYFDSTLDRYLVSENGGGFVNLTGQGPSTWCVLDISDAQFPTTGNAYFAAVQDHSTLEYVNGVASSAYFLCTLPSNYDSTSFVVTLNWAGQATGNVVWGVNIENQNAASFSQNANFGTTGGNGSTQTTATVAASGTAHNMVQSTITYTQANAGSAVAHNTIRIRVQRVGNSGSDTMGAVANLHSVFIRK